MHIQHTKDAQLGRRWESFPALFKIRKKCSNFGKKGPDCVYHWVKFSVENVVLRVSRIKTPKCFPAGPLFLVFFTKCLSKCTSSTMPAYSSETLLRHIQTYSGIFSIQCNAHIFTTLPYSKPCHKTLFSHIQVYSEPCATLAYAETWNTRNPGIFRTLP